MKIIVLNSDNRVLYMSEDDGILEVKSNHVVVDDSRVFGLSSQTVSLYENVENPEILFAKEVLDESNNAITVQETFEHSKFLYDGVSWSLNQDWEEFSANTVIEE
jgi:hypothetical protein